MSERAPERLAHERLSEALARHGLTADKRFGQHFLLDLNLTRKVARLAAPLEGALVLEVGPGPGGLTRALLDEGAGDVTAVEKDSRFLPLLGELEAAAGGRLRVIEGDALKFDLASLRTRSPGAPLKIVANLPYNVGTALLIDWMKSDPQPDLMVLMFQKEVAERIVAPPGAEAYGRLAVIAQYLCAPRLSFVLPARAFTPPPKVESAVVVLEPRRPRPPDPEIRALEAVTAAAFGQRRKMLRSSLKILGGETLCALADVDPTARAETIDLTGFLRLARAHLGGGGTERP